MTCADGARSFHVMPHTSRLIFIRCIAKEHGKRLRRYFASRVDDASDVQDLVQDTYFRLFKVSEHTAIRSHQAYVLTVAASVAREYWLRRSARPVVLPLTQESDGRELSDPEADYLFSDDSPERDASIAQKIEVLGRSLSKLPPKVQAALVWHCRDGHTYDEISARLKVPRDRVKKYLARALAHCRRSAAEYA